MFLIITYNYSIMCLTNSLTSLKEKILNNGECFKTTHRSLYSTGIWKEFGCDPGGNSWITQQMARDTCMENTDWVGFLWAEEKSNRSTKTRVMIQPIGLHRWDWNFYHDPTHWQPITSSFILFPFALPAFYFWLKSMAEGIFSVSSWADWVGAQSFCTQHGQGWKLFPLFHSREPMARSSYNAILWNCKNFIFSKNYFGAVIFYWKLDAKTYWFLKLISMPWWDSNTYESD